MSRLNTLTWWLFVSKMHVFVYQIYILILVYYLSKRNETFEMTGYFLQLLRAFTPRRKAGYRWLIVCSSDGLFSVLHADLTPLMHRSLRHSLPWEEHRFLNMILALVHLIGHLHFINFNPKHLQAIFHRIHFLDVTLIIIVNFFPNLLPYCYPMVK